MGGRIAGDDRVDILSELLENHRFRCDIMAPTTPAAPRSAPLAAI
jgi:hypothetical protein